MATVPRRKEVAASRSETTFLQTILKVSDECPVPLRSPKYGPRVTQSEKPILLFSFLRRGKHLHQHEELPPCAKTTTDRRKAHHLEVEECRCLDVRHEFLLPFVATPLIVEGQRDSTFI